MLIDRWTWLSSPSKMKILDDIKVEDIAFGWKHTMVLGTPRTLQYMCLLEKRVGGMKAVSVLKKGEQCLSLLGK